MIYNTLYNLLLEEFSPEVKDFLAKYREHRKIAGAYNKELSKWLYKHKTTQKRNRKFVPPGRRKNRLGVALDKSFYEKVLPAYDKIRKDPRRQKQRENRPEGYQSSLRQR